MANTSVRETVSKTAKQGALYEDTGRGCLLLVVSDAGIRNIELVPGKIMRFGRRSGMDVVIEHPLVSREHATFYGGDPPEVEDLGSRNGTTVQGTRIQPRQRVPLRPGYVVGIGIANVFVRGRSSVQLPDSSEDTNPGTDVLSITQTPRSRHAAMHTLYERARLVANSSIPVLIQGETGSGKELLAEYVHACSTRRDRPLLRVNCAAFSEGILTSQLFGHEKGAFTGAHATKVGLFEAADGGTLLLDEIGELSLPTQAKLLRVLECGEVTRVGANKARHVDVRVISASNRELRERVSRKLFRSDLYFRLNGITLAIPPLRRRPEDILPIAEFFAQRFSERLSCATPAIGEDAKVALTRHRWPGNVRELKTVIERAVVLCEGGVITAKLIQLDEAFPTVYPEAPGDSQIPDSPLRPRSSVVPESATPESDGGPKSEHSAKSSRSRARLRANQNLTEHLRAEIAKAERERILEALKQGGTQAGAAKLLGISRRTLIYKLEALGMPRPRKGR